MRSLTKSNQVAGQNRPGALFGPAQSRGEGRLGHITLGSISAGPGQKR